MGTFCLQYIVPIVLIVSAYAIIVYDLNFNNQQASSSKQLDQKKRKQNLKITKLAVCMSTVFGLCLLPHHSIAMWFEFGGGSTFTYIGDVNLVAYFILYLNSAIDPLLYNLFNSNFKRELKKLSERSKNSLFPRVPSDSGARNISLVRRKFSRLSKRYL